MERDILERLSLEVKNGKAGVLITLTETQGSVPRRAGAIMAIVGEEVLGTIGGGKLEYEVIKLGKKALEDGKSQEFSYVLTPEESLGMSCGGSAKGFIKVFKPQYKLIIAGGGHIGRALNYHCKNLNFKVTVVDDREELRGTMDNIVIGNYSDVLKKLEVDGETYCVVVTKGHPTDNEAMLALIGRGARYIGMIGSRKKSAGTMATLRENGIPQEEIEKLYTPVGLNISDGTPEEIALEILSEILLLKNRGTLNHRRDVKKC